MMKCIFFNTKDLEYRKIDQEIIQATLINFLLDDTVFLGCKEKRILKKQKIRFDQRYLEEKDIKNIVKEIEIGKYKYNFIELFIKDYAAISKEGFNNFLSRVESELIADIQSKKIINIEKEYRKLMYPNRQTINTSCVKNKENDEKLAQNSDSFKNDWIIYEKTAKEIEMLKLKYEKEEKEEEIKKAMLKSLYYLQTFWLRADELEELIEIYEEYIDKISKYMAIGDNNFLIRCVIHSICILEKIYMVRLRLEKTNKIEARKFKVFGILTKKVNLKLITYELLEEELIKCLLIKIEDKKYLWQKISLSFYLTTPLRMSCLAYVRAVLGIDILTNKMSYENKELENKLKNALSDPKEYNKFLTGSKKITESGLNKFFKTLYENIKDIEKINYLPIWNHMLNLIYFQYKEKNIISKIYSDENVSNYEITLLNNDEDGYENKKKISEIIILYNFIFEITEITLRKLSNMEKEFKIGIDCVIELNQENIIKNNKKISLDLLENKGTESYFIIKKYLATSRLVLNNNPCPELNKRNYLVKLLDIKVIDEKKFYTFEMNVIFYDTSAKERISGLEINTIDIGRSQIITFVLTEQDFRVLGKVLQINRLENSAHFFNFFY